VAAPTPPKIRRAIVRAVRKQRLTYEQTAELLGVGRATVSRVLSQQRRTGSVAPRPSGGGWRSPIQGRLAALLRSIVTQMPDATVDELTAALTSRVDIQTSRSGVLRALHRMGFSRKKSPSPHWSETHPGTDGFVDSSAPS
jgi:transposase